jgi:hypothetical protein
MSEISCNEFNDFPVIETTTGLIELYRGVVASGNPPLLNDVQTPTYIERFDYIIEFGYVVPTYELISTIKAMDTKWVSVGSGLGFIEYLLHKNGIDIIATDIQKPIYNPYFRRSAYIDIVELSAYDAIKTYNRNIILSWPCMDNPWAYECIRQIKSGTKLIYIGEGFGGCTADNAFNVYLDRNFQLEHKLPHINFNGIDDSISLYTRL